MLIFTFSRSCFGGETSPRSDEAGAPLSGIQGSLRGAPARQCRGLPSVAGLGHFAAEGGLSFVLHVLIPGKSSSVLSLGVGLLPGERCGPW